MKLNKISKDIGFMMHMIQPSISTERINENNIETKNQSQKQPKMVPKHQNKLYGREMTLFYLRLKTEDESVFQVHNFHKQKKILE